MDEHMDDKTEQLERMLHESSKRLDASLPSVDVERVKHAVRLKEKRNRRSGRTWYMSVAAVVTLLLLGNVVFTWIRPEGVKSTNQPIATDTILDNDQGMYYVNYYPDNKGADSNILALFMREEQNRQPEVIHSQFVQHADAVMTMEQMPIEESRYLLLSTYQSVHPMSEDVTYQHVVFIFDDGRMEPLMELEGYVRMMEENRFESDNLDMTIVPILINKRGIYSNATSVSIQVGQRLGLLMNGEKTDVGIKYDSSIVSENETEDAHIIILEGKQVGRTVLTLSGHGTPQSLDINVTNTPPMME